VVYNGDSIKPGTAAAGVRLCPLPVTELSQNSRNKLEQNTLAVAAGLSMMGIGFQALEEVLSQQFKKKGDTVIKENVTVARAAYDYATAHFEPFPRPLPMTDNRIAVLTATWRWPWEGRPRG